MNNLAYSSQDPDVVAPKVAELVANEIKSTPSYEIQVGDSSPATVGRVVTDGLKLLFGGKAASTLFTVHFTLTTPRSMSLSVPLDRQGVGCHGGGVTYVTALAKPVAGEATLGAPKFFGGAKFEGNAEVAAKLNANAALLKRLKGFVRSKGNMGGVEIEIPQLVRVAPSSTGSTLIINNLPKPLKMGFSMSLEIVELAEIAALVEASL